MIETRLKLGALAVACCFVLILVPVLANAQVGGVIQKGAQGVQKGVETGVEKTKEGAEATKNAITGEDQDQNRMKPQESQQNPSATESQPSETGQRSMPSESAQKTETGQKNMPRTAGELPLLALAGCLALSAAGLSRIIRRHKNY